MTQEEGAAEPEAGFPRSTHAMVQKILAYTVQVLQNTERLMADVTGLQAADAALKAEVTQAITDWQAALGAANGDQAAVDAVTADMQATVQQLQASDPSTPPSA